MRAALVIAAKDLRQRLRDRSALVLGIVAPLAISAVMSIAFGSTETFRVQLALVDDDGGPLAAALVEVLGSDELADILDVEPADDLGGALERIDAREADVAVVVPAGFSAAAASADPLAIDVVSTVDTSLAGQVARSIVSSFTARVDAARLAVATSEELGVPPGDVAGLEPALTLDVRPSGDRELRAISYYAPGMAVFFLLFAIGFTARGFFAERQQSTLDRIAVAPIRPWSVLAGKALAVLVYGAASLATVALITSLAFGADWGHPVAVAVVGLAVVLSVVALTALVITVARTDRQADALSQVLVFGLALLGGSFVMVSQAPDLLRRLALLTPNGWALRAFTDMASSPGGLGDDLELIVRPVAAILLFTAVVAAVAAVRARRVVVR